MFDPRLLASCLTCIDNSINGKPACANSWMLQDVARDAWGFDGCACVSPCSLSSLFLLNATSPLADITSDCGAESDVFINHHYTQTPEQAVKAIFAAGTDSDCR